ncbi:MAG TPA: hypothetical protein VN999_19165 [Thermoanaerobaculia bacterium]|nr:hypothetical protein [Thermoanaerobaculia bacterium]
MRRPGRTPALLALAAALLLPARPARAHLGPPFPILVDRRVGPYVASVWTDPNIGTGTFYVVLEAPPGQRLPPRTRVRVGVQPVSNRLPEVLYEAAPQPVHEGARYYTAVAFDRGEKWRVRVLLDGPEGGGILTSEVEATPAGTLGPIGFVLYGFPFAGVGFLWLKAVLRRRDARQTSAG